MSFKVEKCAYLAQLLLKQCLSLGDQISRGPKFTFNLASSRPQSATLPATASPFRAGSTCSSKGPSAEKADFQRRSAEAWVKFPAGKSFPASLRPNDGLESGRGLRLSDFHPDPRLAPIISRFLATHLLPSTSRLSPCLNPMDCSP